MPEQERQKDQNRKNEAAAPAEVSFSACSKCHWHLFYGGCPASISDQCWLSNGKGRA